MKTKHTQGEWFANNCTVTLPNKRTNDVICRCFCTEPSDQVTQDIYEMQANAKLIAAAPELLEALIEAKVWAEQYGMYSEIYNKMCNAINKATK